MPTSRRPHDVDAEARAEAGDWHRNLWPSSKAVARQAVSPPGFRSRELRVKLMPCHSSTAEPYGMELNFAHGERDDNGEKSIVEFAFVMKVRTDFTPVSAKRSQHMPGFSARGAGDCDFGALGRRLLVAGRGCPRWRHEELEHARREAPAWQAVAALDGGTQRSSSARGHSSGPLLGPRAQT